MESNQPNPSWQEGELSIRELIFKFQDWIKYIWNRRLILMISGGVGAAVGIMVSFFVVPKFEAELTFVLEEAKSNPLGNYAGIASQFGIDLGGGAASGVFSGDNILEFLRSRLMVEKALITPLTLDRKKNNLANVYIEMEGLREKWDKNVELKDFSFPVNGNRKEFSILQDSVLSVLYDRILQNNLTVSRPDKKLSFVSVRCLAKDETFAKMFVERLVAEATDFYVKIKTQRSQSTIDKLQTKADSIEALLNKKTYSVAAMQDMNLNPARNITGVNTEVGMRDKIILQTMFGEVIKNLELSKFTLAQETPIIQVVDSPILPLKERKIGKLVGFLFGGILGGLLAIIGLSIKRVYRSIMNQER